MLLIIPSVTKGQPATIQLSKADLFALSSVVADSYFSDQSNVKSCVIEYNSNPSDQKKVLRFDLSQETPSSAVFMSETARDEFWLEHVILEDFDGGTLVLTRNQLPSGLDILFGESGPQLVSLSISYEKPQIVYVEQFGLNSIQEEVPVFSAHFASPIFVSVEKTPVNASVSLLASPSSLEITEVSGGFEITSNTVTTGSLSVSSGSVASNSLQMVKHELKEVFSNDVILTFVSPIQIIGELSGIVYFSAVDKTELWKTDGTVSGTARLLQNKYINKFSLSINTSDSVVLNNALFVVIADDSSDTNGKLYKITNSSLVPEQVSNINTTAGQGDNIGIVSAAVFNNEIYFTAKPNSTTTLLYKTDGTLNGTILVANTNPSGNSAVGSIVASSDAVYFTARESGTTRVKIFKTTGTEASVVRVSNTFPGNTDSPSSLTAVGSSIYFRSNDNSTTVSKLFRYSSELSDPIRVSNIRPGASDTPASVTKVGSKVFFTALNSSAVRKLYVTEGSEQTTNEILVPNSLTSAAVLSRSSDSFNYLLFTAGSQQTSNYTLFKTDGATTEIVLESPDGPVWSRSHIIQHNDDIILSHPSGIYKLAPESAVPTLISQNIDVTNPAFLKSIVGNNLFLVDAAASYSNLYKLSLLNEDGQNLNTIQLSDFSNGANGDIDISAVFLAASNLLFVPRKNSSFSSLIVLTNANL